MQNKQLITETSSIKTSFPPNFFNETTSVAESKTNALNLITSLFIFKLGNKVGMVSYTK